MRPLVAVTILALLVSFIYWPVGGYDFTSYLDDDSYITNNPVVQRGLTLPGIAWAFRAVHVSNWHPVTWLSHMMDVQLWGMQAGWHHLVNVLFHGCNAILLCMILYRATGALWRSTLVAALFAVHPLHVESVVWISERKDVLSTFFLMLTMAWYLVYVRSAGKLPYLLSVVFYALGLMAKAMLVTLPFALLLLDYWPLGRVRPGWIPGAESPSGPLHKARMKRVLLEKLPFLLLAAASSTITYFAQAGGGAVRTFDSLPFSTRVANAVLSYGSYLLKTVWPRNLAPYYPYHADGTSPFHLLLAGAFLAGATFLAVKQLRDKPFFAVGWFWYLGTLVPVIGLVQVGGQSMADRYTYIPLIGIFAAVVWGGALIGTRWPRRGLLAVPVAAVFLLTAAAYFQVGIWRNNVSWMTHTLSVTSDNWFVHANLGNLYFSEGNTEEAIKHYNASLRIRPGNPMPHNSLGIVFYELGLLEEAITQLNVALSLRPEYVEARVNLGNALDDSGRRMEAISQYRYALRVDPDNPQAHYNLALTLEKIGRTEEAIGHYREVLRIQPDYPDVQLRLQRALSRSRRSRILLPPGDAPARLPHGEGAGFRRHAPGPALLS